MTRKSKQYLGAASALAVAISLACAGGAAAQVSTSTLRGTVFEGAAAEAGGSVTATEVATGYVSRGRIGADGGYVLSGLRPGTYRIDATTADGQTVSDTVTLSLGQVATLDLDVAAGVTGSTVSTEVAATDVGDVVVTGRRIFEVRTSEVATNVTQQQINDLPQISRNFLNFAALAPGVVVQEGDAERTISAGGQPSVAINVFIDGQNQKATIIDGGVAGQDDSRGNPFPQAAVQEFRVLTQNFKAEYEQASSAIITSVSRSGTNELQGDLFVQWQDGDWISQNRFSEERGEPKPRLDRLQYGGSVGGPIIEDRLHYFLTYERKEETRDRTVFLNRTEYAPLFDSELGTFTAPFEQDLLFGKLSWQVDDRQRVELIGTYRSEFDIRDFGNGPTSLDRAVTINGDNRSVILKHQFFGDGFFNEASVDYFSSVYNPRAVNFDQSGARYVVYRDNVAGGAFNFNYNAIETTVFTNGGGANNQDIEQQSLTFKNDLTFNDIDWMGRHTIKAGIKYSMQEYYVAKEFNRNPFFTYDVDARPEVVGSRAIPTQVALALPVAPTVAENNVLGIYLQDDWQVNDRLELNLGIRWDYEDNAVNNDYETPADIQRFITALAAHPNYVPRVDLDEYISTNGRDAFTGAIQPRVGFSYDFFDDEQTVLFGGAGRYYDRIGFNFAFSERFGPVNRTKTIFFSPAGGAYGGQTSTVAWDPIYATREGLDTLLAGTVGTGEVFLVKEGAEMPHTDQFNLGIRQKFGEIQTSLTFSYAKTENEFGWYRLNVNDANSVVIPLPSLIDPDTGVQFPYRNAFYSDHNREREYQAIYLQIDKPYTRDAGYGFNIAYTFAEATQNGSRDQGLSNFDFDYPSIALTPTFNSPGTDRHRIVASGTVDLPWDFRLSSIITLASGKPFTGFNPGSGGKPMWFEFYPEKRSFILPNAFAYRQVDLRLTKEFQVWGGDIVEFTFDAINVFDFKNYSSFNQTYRVNNGTPDAALNPTFGDPTAQFLPTRSFQVGLRYRW
ncbi:TonB-dependent receptor [Roseibacterium beibuensis]|uniref:TonB-dependent receptor n=1 Tax=[Roseibacterium] beibuensis TaxID=1193142 RepID=UPI00217E5869|nr:TonB-dependent receptor [Roseibacterium beibuensis]MCS6625582.1 TonB-dependent receptor [Roseibacterium beibuensis]